MVEKNIVVAMNVRAIERNKVSVVLTYQNGDKKGHLTTSERALEMIDNMNILI